MLGQASNAGRQLADTVFELMGVGAAVAQDQAAARRRLGTARGQRLRCNSELRGFLGDGYIVYTASQQRGEMHSSFGADYFELLP